MKQLLTQKEVAARAGVDIRTVHRWRHKHGLREIRDGYRVYICEADLAQWLDQQRPVEDEKQ